LTTSYNLYRITRDTDPFVVLGSMLKSIPKTTLQD